MGLVLASCSNGGGKQASLCTSASTGTASTICDGPKTPVALTLPRAELLTRVPEPDPVTTASASPETPPDGPVTSDAKVQPEAQAQAPAPAEPDSAKPLSPEAGKSASPADGKKASDDPEKESPPPAVDGGKVRAPKTRLSKIEPIDNRAKPGEPQISNLRDAVHIAISDHPLIGLASARVKEARASIGVAESALYPQLEGRIAVGPGVTGTYQTSGTAMAYFANKDAYGATRGEGSLAGRQILFDFGAIRSDVARTSALYDSELLKLREQTETIASQVSDVYLKLLEQRELYIAATENLRALEKIVKLVEDNEKNGNGTVADMKRVRSRLIDGQSGLADAKAELQTGTDKFIRLVKTSPGTLHQAPLFNAMIPKTPDGAIGLVLKNNPRVQALEASLRAARLELETQKKTILPKLAFETDVGLKEYRTNKDRTELDAKGMLTLKYKFFDGGLQSSQVEQGNARLVQAEMRMRNDLDDTEADIRKQYRILQSARSKSASLQDNVVTSEKARQLYDEQFRGGKRTLLELLDIQTTYYTTRRTAISNKFEEQRSINAILLDIGKLTEATLTGR